MRRSQQKMEWQSAPRRKQGDLWRGEPRILAFGRTSCEKAARRGWTRASPYGVESWAHGTLRRHRPCHGTLRRML